MANNLFEKYGIKDVANVTLYRIDRKDATYESQRKISISSILKSALTRGMVYPLDENGKGADEGFEAYVFKNADILTHFNYDCDDVFDVKGTALFIDNEKPLIAGDDKIEKGEVISGSTFTDIVNYLKAGIDEYHPNLFFANNVSILSCIEKSSGRNLRTKLNYLFANGYGADTVNVNAGGVVSNGPTADATSFDVNVIPVSTYRADFVTPVTMTGIDKDALVAAVGANGQLNWSGTTLTSGYITFIAPTDASPAEIMNRFQAIQHGLYESLGIIVRLTQPVKTNNSTEGKFTGIITASVTYNTGTEGTVTFTFDDATIDGSTATIINSIKSTGKITNEQITALETLAGSDADVTVAYAPAGVEDHIDTVSGGFEAEIEEDFGYNTFLITFTAKLGAYSELGTGIYDMNRGDATGHYAMDPDGELHGTHEFSYAEQICMLFAKNQNLITKAGTRYQFTDADDMFPGFEFNDQFAGAPNSRDRLVVVGLVDKTSENLYDFEEINDAIKNLTGKIDAKAYDVVYTDYAELIVEDEMGYYLPQQLGGFYNKKTETVSFFDQISTYKAFAEARRGVDLGIYSAVNTWGDDTHYSINDAIDALKQGQKLIDSGNEFSEVGYSRVFGGYKVTGKESQSTTPLDDIGRGLQYEDYTINGNVINDVITGNKLSSLYNLDSVLQALSVADLNGEVGQIRISSTAQMESNRAIYVNPESGVLANRANIYLLKNVHTRSLNLDKNGVFEFYDKKGNKLYYQDKVFAGTPTLALVVIGGYGLVFVVDRHCTKNTEKIAWMINDNGYITDKQAERVVKNGLIHTVEINCGNDSFDATCTVGSIKVRKIVKNVVTYKPVLYLDTLKVSTLSLASESTDARGGTGNSKLMTWDYGKEITLNIEDALFTPASMAAIWGGDQDAGKNGVKDATVIDRMIPATADRSFIVPAGNQDGFPAQGEIGPEAVYVDPKTMEPFQDGTPIAKDEFFYKWTRTVGYEGQSLGSEIEISADKFPGVYRVVGETVIKQKNGGKEQRFQFIIPEAKMSAQDTSITLEADGDPTVFSFTMDVLRPEDGIMMKFVAFDVVDNDEQKDGSTMVKDTENLNILDDAEMYKVGDSEDEDLIIGATEY